MSRGYFYGHLGTAGAEAILSSHSPGTFIVRFWPQEPGFVVSGPYTSLQNYAEARTFLHVFAHLMRRSEEKRRAGGAPSGIEERQREGRGGVHVRGRGEGVDSVRREPRRPPQSCPHSARPQVSSPLAEKFTREIH